MGRQYITTAIDFPNGAPHMGHVMEKVLADVCARWFRLRGDETRFQIGTDDHGIKIQRTAEEAGMSPPDFVKQNIPAFQDLFDRLQISYDCFMSTSVTPGHYDTVQALWQRLQESGNLEKRTYTGLYCTGCEEFKNQRDLVDGLCPNHQTAPEEVSEDNWFFKLSEHQDYLKQLLHDEENGYHVVPEFRAQEVYAFQEQGLEDVSFSRPKSTLYWGVPVPGDEDQVMYVWCDNLTNYISTLGYLTENQQNEWWDDAEVTHVIGKDITRFHGLNWPAMLHAAGVRTPDRLLVHGFITCDGSKMSKSLGNVVVPDDVLEHFGGNPDPLRFYLSHEIPVGNDGDFSWERIDALYDAKLRNDIGNLLNRVLAMLHKEGGELGDFSPVPEGSGVDQLVPQAWTFYIGSMNNFAVHDAINTGGHNQITTLLNQHIGIYKPWERTREEKIGYLTELAEALRHVSLMLLPFVPDTAQRMAKQLNVPYADQMLERDFVITDAMREWGSQSDWKQVGEPEILFAPLE